MIGFVLHSLTAAMLPALLRQTQELLYKKGYDLHFALTFGEPEREKEVTDMMLFRGYDGIIFNSPPVYPRGHYEAIGKLIDSGIPFVVLGNYDHHPVSQICGDFKMAGKAVTEHLLNLGHKRIAYIGREGGRLDGYMEAHRNAEVQADLSLVFTSKDVIAECSKQTEKAIESGITAIFAHYDEVAIKILRILKKLGKNVPGDIALAGIGDEQYSDLLDPPLTTYRMHEENMASHLVDMIMDKIKNPAAGPHTILLPGELVARESTLGVKK
jgi:DNA-binding LacI/PurR family transcriptional regulator